MIDQTQGNSDQPTVALFLPDLGVGGAERVFVTLAGYFVRQGFQVDLVLASKSGPLLSEVDPNVNIVDLESLHPEKPAWLFALKTLFSLIRYLRMSPPDAMLVTLTGANLTATLAKILSRRKIRLVIREAASLANVRSTLRLVLMRYIYPYADKIVVLTESMKEEISASIKLPEEHITIIANPVDCERVQTLAADSDDSDTFSEIRPYAVFVGRLVEQKDCRTALHAVARVNRKRPLNMVIVGDGPQRAELIALSKELGVRERIHDLGYRSNPYPWIKNADVFMLSSKWEGYPNVLLEAMCLEKPVVITEYDASPRHILSAYPKQLHRIVSVGDEIGMANGVLDLLEGEAPVDGTTEYKIDKIADQYLQVLGLNTMPK